MAVLPADEDYARALLSLFKARRLGPGQSVRLTEARADFLRENMGRLADFEAALQYALSRAWLALSLDRVRLTAPGAEEMHSAGGFLV